MKRKPIDLSERDDAGETFLDAALAGFWMLLAIVSFCGLVVLAAAQDNELITNKAHLQEASTWTK